MFSLFTCDISLHKRWRIYLRHSSVDRGFRGATHGYLGNHHTDYPSFLCRDLQVCPWNQTQWIDFLITLYCNHSSPSFLIFYFVSCYSCVIFLHLHKKYHISSRNILIINLAVMGLLPLWVCQWTCIYILWIVLLLCIVSLMFHHAFKHKISHRVLLHLKLRQRCTL